MTWSDPRRPVHLCCRSPDPAAVRAVISAHRDLIAHDTLASSATLVDPLSEGLPGTVGGGEEILVHALRA